MGIREYVALLVLGLCLMLSCVVVSFDKSLDYTLWVKGAAKDEYARYDYVHIGEKYLMGKRLVKQVTCAAGDYLKRLGDMFFCNDTLIAAALHNDRFGNPLAQFGYDGVIPAGFYFVQGTNERSFDSRYFGLVPRSDILRELYPAL